jgi:peptidoglycan/LPS O-acetylase OafA/YrhL
MGLYRLILAVSILIAHSTPIFGNSLIGGRVAVETFFLMSGFYMALVLTNKYKNNLPAFYKNRFLKLFPMYWLFLFLCLALGLTTKVGLQAFFDFNLSTVSKIILFFVNVSPFGQDITNFLALNTTTGNLFFTNSFRNYVPEIWNFLILPQTWAISLEIFFYLLVPWLNKQKTYLLIIICAFSLILRLILYYIFHLNHDPWEYRFFPTEMLFFTSGIISFRLYQKINFKINPLFFIIIFMLTIFYQSIPLNNQKMILYFVVVFISMPLLFKFTKNFSFDRLLGELSYPLYLSHFFIINILSQLINVNHQHLGLYSLLICLPLSILVHHFFQKPIDNYRQKIISVS